MKSKPKRDKLGRFKKGFCYSPKTQFKKGQHWRNKKPFWDKEWLYNAYITNKKTIPELGVLCGCGDSNISYWIVKHKIPFRPVSETRKIKHWGAKGEKNGMYGIRGKNHPGWKGGHTEERQKFYNTLEWKSIVPIIFKRDNYSCQRCNCKNSYKNPLHIHHLVSFSIRKLRAIPQNLILICEKCHHWIHSNKNIKKEYILTYNEFKQKEKSRRIN